MYVVEVIAMMKQTSSGLCIPSIYSNLPRPTPNSELEFRRLICPIVRSSNSENEALLITKKKKS